MKYILLIFCLSGLVYVSCESVREMAANSALRTIEIEDPSLASHIKENSETLRKEGSNTPVFDAMEDYWLEFGLAGTSILLTILFGQSTVKAKKIKRIGEVLSQSISEYIAYKPEEEETVKRIIREKADGTVINRSGDVSVRQQMRKLNMSHG